MQPLKDIYMIDLDSRIDEELLKEIYLSGYSRIPVFEGTRSNIVGLLMSRDLLVVNTNDQVLSLRQIGGLLLRDVITIQHDTKLELVLKEFKKGRSHMALVTQPTDDQLGKDTIGIITLEDVIEAILRAEVVDEADLEKEMTKKGIRYHKQQLITLFAEKSAAKVLSEPEIDAVCAYLEEKVPAFFQSRLEKIVLRDLVRSAQVKTLVANTEFIDNNTGVLMEQQDYHPTMVKVHSAQFKSQIINDPAQGKIGLLNSQTLQNMKSDYLLGRTQFNISCASPDHRR
jgi:metal transporter CNNM